MATRDQNERNFRNWEDVPDGGRRYWKDYRSGRSGWARYLKIVDAAETTLAVIQEIYDRNDNLIAVHEKFPIDKGHRRIKEA
jgi:hypothetical protein